MAGHELHQAPFRSVPADGCRYQAHALPHQFVYGLLQAVEPQLFQEPDIRISGRTHEIIKNWFGKHYTKCLKELDRFGPIRYEPSYNPHRGSHIYLYSFDKGDDKGTDTGSEIAVRPYTNNTNPLNHENETNLGEQAKKNDSSSNVEEMKKEKSSAKRERTSGYGPDIPPLEEHVKIYFEEKGYPPLEAEKFYNYFRSNGW